MLGDCYCAAVVEALSRKVTTSLDPVETSATNSFVFWISAANPIEAAEKYCQSMMHL